MLIENIFNECCFLGIDSLTNMRRCVDLTSSFAGIVYGRDLNILSRIFVEDDAFKSDTLKGAPGVNRKLFYFENMIEMNKFAYEWRWENGM